MAIVATLYSVMPKAETITDYHFPKAGLSVADAFGRQPGRKWKDGNWVHTTASAQNVRAFDHATGRDRGGSRSGLAKYIAARLPTTAWVVQNLNVLSTATGTEIPGMELSVSGRVVYLIAVSQGVVKVATPGDTTWTATTNNTGQTPPLNITGVMQSTPLNQLLFFADGINYCYYKPPTNSVELWTPTAGALPRDSAGNGCRLASTWRGSVVLSGLIRDPQNWFICKVGDPFDLEYSNVAGNTGVEAIAGNNSPLGLIGDPVTALIPFTDDVMIFGGDHTIWAMRGDPRTGGSIDRVSDITGIMFGKAWCKDPYGNAYFFGGKPGIWMMTANSPPRRISQPIEPRLEAIDTGNVIVTAAWDDRQQTAHFFVTESSAPAATTHFVWDYRAQAWWPDVFTNTDHNPLCCVEYDGNDPDDRAVLVGGWDGYVRFLDPDASTDDGTAITSSVILGPIMTQELDEMLLKELQWVLADASGNVTWSVHAGDTAETALTATAVSSGTAVAGRNFTQAIRVAQHAIYVKITSTNKWAMESLRVKFAGRGKVRRRG